MSDRLPTILFALGSLCFLVGNLLILWRKA
jgi:hypothetical protein